MPLLLLDSPPSRASFLILGLVIIIATVVVRRLRSTPYDKVPLAHWTCSFSPIWILWQRYHNRELKSVLAAHRKHGKIVRVAPTELSISDYETGVRQVYNAGFEKPRYFDFFRYFGVLNSFASLTRADHAACRRRISTCYSKTSLFSSSQLSQVTHEIIYTRLLPVLSDHATAGQPAELLKLIYAASLDMLNCYILGMESGPNFTQDPAFAETWLHHYENKYAPQCFWLQEVPWLAAALRGLGWDVMPRQHYSSTRWIEDWMLRHCDRAEAVYQRMQHGEHVPTRDIPIVYSQMRKAMSSLKDGQFLGMPVTDMSTRISIASEIFDHMSGAREVFGLVLAYAIYYIGQNPEQQLRLQHQVAELGLAMSQQQGGTEGFSAVASPQALAALGYLQAVIKESLRLRPNSTPLPRITPADRPVSIAGVAGVPPNTRVNCFQWFLHRDPALWPEPDRWLPDRWLDEAGIERPAAELPPLWAFVTGPRACVGMQLSYYLFGYTLAAIFANFTVEIAKPETYGKHSPGSLEDELWVKFHALEPRE